MKMSLWLKKINNINVMARLGLMLFVGFFFLYAGVNYFTFWTPKIIQANFDKKSPYLSVFSPLDRVTGTQCSNDDCSLAIWAEPVYFNLLTPIRFDRGEVDILFKSENQPIFDLGVAVGSELSAMKLYPVKNQLLEDLINNPEWNVVRKDNVYLLQKENKFSTIEDFFKEIPYSQKVAFYNYEYAFDFQVADYQPQKKVQILPIYAFGSQNLFVYAKDEPIVLVLNFADLNNKPGDDDITLNVYSAGEKEKIWTAKISDNGEDSPTGIIDNLNREIQVEAPDEGVYRIEVIASDDVVLKEVETPLQKIVFDRKINFLPTAEILNYWPKIKLPSLDIYTETQNIYFQTFLESGLQNVSINGRNLEIAERNKVFRAKEAVIKGQTIKIPARGLLVQSDGFISLNKNQFFNHQPYNFRSIQALFENDFDFILARYEAPENLDNGWMKATVKINLQEAYYQKRQVKFMISLPGIEANMGSFYLSDLTFKLFRH